MNLESTSSDSVTIVRCTGNLDSNSSPEAEGFVNKLIDDGASKLLIDLTNVDFVSSAGLRILLATAKRLGSTGGGLRITGLNDVVNEVFEISGFSTILSVFASEEEALQGF